MDEKPKTRFTINVRGYVVNVDYTPDYFSGMDHFAYLSPHDPPRPHPVSETGYRSHFADKGDVEKAGGPEAFAAWYAEQIAAEKDRKPRKGGHAARIAEEKGTPQRELF